MRAVILGASGGHGRALAKRLADSDHYVRGFVRDASRAAAELDDVVVGDAITGRGLEEALASVDVAYSFIHSLEPGRGGIDSRDVVAAAEIVKAARAVGLERLVFFSIFMPPTGEPLTDYQANRRAVERVLLEGLPGAVVIRSGISLGPGLRGIRMHLGLVRRSPIVPLGPWRHNHAAVVDVDTELDAFVAAGTQDGLAGGIWDVPQSAEPTHEQLIRELIDILGVRRTIVRLPVSNRRLDARVMALLTGDDYELCDYLAGVTRTTYLPDPARAQPFKSLTPLPLHDALERTVADWQDLPRYASRRPLTATVPA